jgi:hypothetical protein
MASNDRFAIARSCRRHEEDAAAMAKRSLVGSKALRNPLQLAFRNLKDTVSPIP